MSSMFFLSIRRTFPLTILVPLLVTVGLTGWIAFVNGQRTVNKLSSENSRALKEQIKGQLSSFLATPHIINQLNADAIQLNQINLQNPDSLERYFWVQARQFQAVDGIEFGYQADGGLRSVVRANETTLAIEVASPTTAGGIERYSTDWQGNRVKLLQRNPKYDARERPWYQKAASAQRAAWTDPFPKFGTQELRVSAVQPVFNSSKTRLLGVLAVDFYLTRISRFLQTLKIGENGKVFIIEPSGALIATSTEEPLFQVNGKEFTRFSALDSKTPIVQAAAKHLNSQFNGFRQVPSDEFLKFSMNGENQLLRVARFSDNYNLDWLVILVVPERDFMGNIEESTRWSLGLGLVALVCGVMLGLLATRWLVDPILKLNQSAKELSVGEFEPQTLATVSQRSDELGELARVFQDMAVVIENREQSLQDRVQQLLNETNTAKKASMATRLGKGSVNLATLLDRSQRVRSEVQTETLQLTDLLRQVPYFQSFTPAQLEELILLGHKQSLHTGEFVFHEDEPGTSFYIVLSGRIDIYVEKLKKPLTVLSSGGFFGELSLLLGVPRTATARALETSILFVVDQQGFKRLLQSYQELNNQVAEKLHDRKAELEQRKDSLRKSGLLGDEATFNQNFLAWIHQRLAARFGS